jgi:hypothetical protein
MDPFTFVATIVGVVEVGVEISLQLSRLARKMKGARREVEDIADEFNCIATTLTNLRETLEEGRRNGQVFHSQAFVDDIERLLRRIQRVQDDAWDLIPKNFRELEDVPGAKTPGEPEPEPEAPPPDKKVSFFSNPAEKLGNWVGRRTGQKSEMNVIDRFNWMFKQGKARGITQKMNTLKSTLTVMLAALQVAKLEKLMP